MNPLRKSWKWFVGLFIFLTGAFVILQKQRALKRASNAEEAQVKLNESQKKGYIKNASRAAENAKREIQRASEADKRIKERINVLEANQSDGLAGRLSSWNRSL